MQSLMSLIDKNATLIPEGDYLKMCQLMMELDRNRKCLLVTPDVVGEDFIITSEALNKCHKWILATETLREATSLYWRELIHTQGYEALMWFVHKGTLAHRYYGMGV